jgi:hypothetical protein
MKPASAARGLVNGWLLASGTLSAFTGFLIQIHFHMQRTTGAVWGLAQPNWSLIHQIVSFAMLGFVGWHLWLNRKPLLALLGRPAAWSREVNLIVVLFFVAVATSLAAWMTWLFFADWAVERALVEIHDKATVPLAVLLVLHTWRRRTRLFRRPLLLPERHEWIHPCRATGREQSGQERDRQDDADGPRERPGIVRGHAEQETRHQPSAEPRQGDAGCDARDGDHQRLAQDHPDDG